ncbi:unnamed protein product [Protopolystoma xenopodis]|uniref:Secreted protein n=1 Tax=Protopolystoma xenopodis TaxID=117903 RepID=A0A3S5CLT1_9PLAT|nr:unnamed protein product [Protopolystoma xenopodis]
MSSVVLFVFFSCLLLRPTTFQLVTAHSWLSLTSSYRLSLLSWHRARVRLKSLAGSTLLESLLVHLLAKIVFSPLQTDTFAYFLALKRREEVRNTAPQVQSSRPFGFHSCADLATVVCVATTIRCRPVSRSYLVESDSTDKLHFFWLVTPLNVTLRTYRIALTTDGLFWGWSCAIRDFCIRDLDTDTCKGLRNLTADIPFWLIVPVNFTFSYLPKPW